MKASIKLLALSLGGVVVVGGGISAAAYFLIEKDTPTDVAYIFDGKTFKTSSQVKDYIFDKSTPKTVPTFNGTAYKDLSGEYSLKSAWDAASKGFQLVQDGYATNALPSGADTTFVPGFNDSNLMTNNVETKTAYAIRQNQTNRVNEKGDEFYLYPTAEEAKESWTKINPVKQFAPYVATNLNDAQLAFNSRTKDVVFPDTTFMEVQLTAPVYSTVFDDASGKVMIRPMSIPLPNGQYLESQNTGIGGTETGITKTDPSRQLHVWRTANVESGPSINVGWKYTDLAKDYSIDNPANQYTKIYRIADSKGNIINPLYATTNENFLNYRNPNVTPDLSFYHWDADANQPKGILPEHFPELIKYVPTKDSGFDFTFSDSSLGTQNYKDLNEFYEQHVTTTGSK